MGLAGKRTTKVGVLATCLRDCVETSYVDQLLSCFAATDVQVTLFAAEGAGDLSPASSQAHVVRCWNPRRANLDGLSEQLTAARVDVLHVIAPLHSFVPSCIAGILKRYRAAGGKVLLDLLPSAVLDAASAEILNECDRILVTSEQASLEVLAVAGNVPVSVIGPRHRLTHPTLSEFEARKILQLGERDRMVLAFAGNATVRDFEILADGIRNADSSAVLTIAPYSLTECGDGLAYDQESWRAIAQRLLSRPHVRVLGALTHWDDLAKCLSAAEIVTFIGTPPADSAAEYLWAALAAKRAIVAPVHEAFLGHEGRVWYTQSRQSLAQSVATVLRSPVAAETLRQNTGQWLAERAERDRYSELASLYVALTAATPAGSPARVERETGYAVPQGRPSPTLPVSAVKAPVRGPRILMQNRENAYTHPGGDTVVMDRVSEGLRARGVTVDIDLKNERSIREYDLVHLFNFALKDNTEKLAKQCQQAGVPYVVTTMYEDWPLFFNQMQAHTSALEAYLQSDQPVARWAEFFRSARAARPSPIWDNSLTANFSAALIATGSNEAASLRRDYPAAKRIETYFCGSDCQDTGDGGEMFRRETGLSDFVLCVGRFELRKNQLMLLKALEESDLTLVFAGGGFSYQPQYLDACKRFKRKGKTVFLDRLDGKMLVSGFQAAKAHVLPSWYELPGIVSIEAARLGTNIVVTDYGTARDYFGDLAWYCRPDEPETIANAVTAAFYAPKRPGLPQRVQRYTWDAAALRNGEIYQSVLAERGDFDWSFLGETRVPAPSMTQRVTTTVESVRTVASEATASVERLPNVVAVTPAPIVLQPTLIAAAASLAVAGGDTEAMNRLCDEGDDLLRQGNAQAAQSRYDEAIRLNPERGRPWRCKGVLGLHQFRNDDAEAGFQAALRIDPSDAKSQVGLGMVRWAQGRKDDAFELFLACARANPSDGTAILHLVRCAYDLDRLAELEHALRAFLKNDQDNVNILYCLAGCCFRRGRSALALGVIERILKLEPENVNALELKAKIDADIQSGDPAAETAVAAGSPVAQAADAPRPYQPTSRLDELEALKRSRKHEELLRGVDHYLQDTSRLPEEVAHASVLRAEALACLGRLDQADALFGEWESHPVYGFRALAGRGVVCAASEKWPQAESFFHRSLSLNTNSDVALAGLGLCEIAQGTKERAWDYFQRALRVNPENLRALLGVVELGYILQRLPETAKALETYLDYRPIDLSINYAYAGCCYALGQKEQAIQELRKILLLDPEYSMAQELLKKIETEGRTAVNAR